MRQFLLNADGSIPAGTNLHALVAAGIALVVPSPRPDPAPGQTVEERPPEAGPDGILRQVWALVELPEGTNEEAPLPAPPPEAVVDALAYFVAGLSEEQRAALARALEGA